MDGARLVHGVVVDRVVGEVQEVLFECDVESEVLEHVKEVVEGVARPVEHLVWVVLVESVVEDLGVVEVRVELAEVRVEGRVELAEVLVESQEVAEEAAAVRDLERQLATCGR